MKRAWVTSPDEVGLSKDTLFLESESGEEVVDWVVTEESKALPAGLVELQGTFQAQTIMLQGRLVSQEWLAG